MWCRLQWITAGGLAVAALIAMLRKQSDEGPDGELQEGRGAGDGVQPDGFQPVDDQEAVHSHSDEEAPDGQGNSSKESEQLETDLARSVRHEHILPEEAEHETPVRAAGFSHTSRIEDIGSQQSSETAEILYQWQAKQQALEAARSMNVEVNALMEQVCHLEDCRMLLISEKGDLQKQLEEAKWHIKQLRTQVQSLQGSAESDGNDDRTMQDMRPHPKEASALEDMDKRYLRNAIVMGFRKGVLPKNSPMFGLLSGLLGFSSEDVEDKKEESGALPKQMGKGLSTLQSVLRRLKKS